MFRRFGLLVSATAVVLAGCGGGQGQSNTTVAQTTTSPVTVSVPETTVETVASGFPVTIDAANGEVVIESQPTAIVSLSPTATEMLFAVGAGDQVAAVDEYSYYPEEAPVTALSGYTPNVEAIAGYEPDLVVLADDIDGVIGSLQGLGIPVLQLPAAAGIDDVYAQIRQVGTATGHLTEAETLVDEMESTIVDLLASVPVSDEPVTVYHELDATFYSASSASFIGQIYALVGVENIADAVDSPESFGYPQLSAEYIIESDPDIIFLADAAYGESAETVAARPGWAGLQAVVNGRVVPVDADIASRWGPRIVEFLEVVVATVSEVREG